MRVRGQRLFSTQRAADTTAVVEGNRELRRIFSCDVAERLIDALNSHTGDASILGEVARALAEEGEVASLLLGSLPSFLDAKLRRPESAEAAELALRIATQFAEDSVEARLALIDAHLDKTVTALCLGLPSPGLCLAASTLLRDLIFENHKLFLSNSQSSYYPAFRRTLEAVLAGGGDPTPAIEGVLAIIQHCSDIEFSIFSWEFASLLCGVAERGLALAGLHAFFSLVRAVAAGMEEAEALHLVERTSFVEQVTKAATSPTLQQFVKARALQAIHGVTRGKAGAKLASTPSLLESVHFTLATADSESLLDCAWHLLDSLAVCGAGAVADHFAVNGGLGWLFALADRSSSLTRILFLSVATSALEANRALRNSIAVDRLAQWQTDSDVRVFDAASDFLLRFFADLLEQD